jgi:PadR family transcriptional regulator, regulatory protein PadR
VTEFTSKAARLAIVLYICRLIGVTRVRKTSVPTLALLLAMLERPRAWQYGYELAQLTGLKSGTLYPILMRLCDRKLFESKWQPSPSPGRPPRHMYRLTASGAVFAKEQMADSRKSKSREPQGTFA